MTAPLTGRMSGDVGRAIGAALLLLCAQTPDTVAQDMLPPGPGWTVAGPATLVDPVSPMAAVVQPAFLSNRILTWWIAASRPFGVEGLKHVEAAAVTSMGSGAVGCIWRQLEGDGLRHIEAELSCGLPIVIAARPARTRVSEHGVSGAEGDSGVWLGAGAGFQALSGSGVRRYGAALCHLSAVAVWGRQWRAAVAYRRGFGRNGDWIRPWIGGAIGKDRERFSVRAGVMRPQGGDVEPALALAWGTGRLRIDAGAWGVTTAPAIGLHLVVKDLCWSVEGRWVPGLGLHLLWSVCSPHLWRP